jgi:hypothetical protein
MEVQVEPPVESNAVTGPRLGLARGGPISKRIKLKSTQVLSGCMQFAKIGAVNTANIKGGECQGKID